ncbi:MAG: PilT/PilU family type 4a pilus ATPase [Kofleriaceae bacterium]
MLRLGQLLGYLERDGISELVIGTGRPISIRKGEAYQTLIAAPTSAAQLHELVRGNELGGMLPERDTNGAPTAVRLLGKPYRVQVARRGEALLLKIERDVEDGPASGDREQARGPDSPPERRAGASERGAPEARRSAPSLLAASPASERSTKEPAPPPSSSRRPAGAARAPDAPPAIAARPAPASPPSSSSRPRAPDGAPVTAARFEASPEPALAARPGGRAQPRPAAPPPGALELDEPGALKLDEPGGVELTLAEEGDDSIELDIELDAVDAPVGARRAADAGPPAVALAEAPATPAWALGAAPASSVPVAAPASGVSVAAPAPSRSAPAVAPVARVSAGFPRAVPEAFVALVRAARQRGATDLHVAAGQPPLARAVGQLHPLGGALDAPAVAALLEPWLSSTERAALAERGYTDLALELPGTRPGLTSRVRANVSRQRGGLKGAFRLVWEGVPTLESLGLPRELARVTSYHQGLVVVAGPSGHGKTTTLAALVDLINSSRPHHVLCVEDPVEIVHPRKTAVVSQREVGVHTASFATALKASLREDPDVIVIGEIRDRETVEIALTAAETGHLVIATMSTPSAAKTIDRLIDMFPPDDQSQVRVSLAAALRFILAQRLLPRREGGGVVPAVELLTGVLPVAALIRDNKLFQLPNLQQRGRAFGMIRFDDSILELVRAGVVDEAPALAVAENKRELHALLHPPEPSAAAPPPSKSWDDAKQRLGGLFKRDRGSE